jgi:RND family efflux transporter MFP subunit
MKRRDVNARPFLLLPSCLLLVGCARSQAEPQMAPPAPEVLVSLPITREVRDFEDFPGRVEAVNSVEIRARVSGYLDKVHFKEGADVKKGDLLFEIDPRLYEADLARAEGSVIQSEGRLKRMESDYRRALDLYPKGAMGREDVDRILGDRADAVGALEVAKANKRMAALNLSYTKVQAPLSGRISRRFIDPGNLVKADDTSLTTIVSLDPIYANFDLDERSTLRLQRLIREKKVKWSPDAGLPVLLGLADEEGFPKHGVVTFADNRVDADTGTWRLRGRFDNPDLCLSPGLFVRIRLPIGESYRATLVSEQALSTDQGQKNLYVVEADGKVAYRGVKVGRLHNGLRIIADGIGPQEKVIVSGLQRVRPGMEVQPKLVDMPGASDSSPSATSGGPGNGNHRSEKKASG